MNLEDKEQYINIIKYLQTVLEFYANEENYSVTHLDDKNYEESKINLDKGYQASFALKSIKNITDKTEEMEEDYQEILKQYKEHIKPNDNEDHLQELKKYINQFNK